MAAFWRNVLQFQTEKITPWIALRNTLGVLLPLALGAAMHAMPAGLALSTGALNVSYSDSHEAHLHRARRMMSASVLVAVAVFIGALSGGNNWLPMFIAGCWAFIAGILVALSTNAADLGVISLVTLVVYAAVPLPFEKAANAGLLALVGGLFQTLLSLAAWPLRRYVPVRRALAALFLELSRTAGSPIQALEAPPATAQTTEAHNALSMLDQDHSLEGERYRMLFSQAERIHLSLLALARLRIRLGREGDSVSEISRRYLRVCSQILGAIGKSLVSGEPAAGISEQMKALNTLTEAARTAAVPDAPSVAAVVRDAQFQMSAIAGQLRAVFDLAGHTTPAGLKAFERRESQRPLRLRLAGSWATVRANLSLDSATYRHALRLAICVAIGEGLGRGFELRRSYWLPMTIAIVLKPDFTSTFSRGVVRIIGTFAGLAFSTGLFHLLPAGIGAQLAAIAFGMFVLRSFGSANYGIFVLAVTALVVLMIALTGVAPKEVMGARAFNTVAGGVIALLAYLVWPTWERKQVPEVMARMLDAYRDYFRAIRESYLNPETPFAREVDRTRAVARRARSNLEGSIDRLNTEPGTSPETKTALSGMLASSHRLVHALMALEAGLLSSQPVRAREAFRPFANHVELTLYLLGAALRGSPLTRAALPDLREDHHALVHSGDSLTERYAMVNVETDRITNSLNTLSEQVLGWINP